ncbi:MAG: response regulator [Bacteroidia bacterium]
MQLLSKFPIRHRALISILLWTALWCLFLISLVLLLGFSIPGIGLALIGSIPFGQAIWQARTTQNTDEALRFGLLNNILADIVVLDRAGKIVFVNTFAVPDPQLNQLAIGKTLKEYGLLAGRIESVSRKRQEAIEKVIDSGQEFEWEETVIEDDVSRDFIRKITPVYEAGQLSRLILYGLEITARKNAQKAAIRRAAFQRTINYFSRSLFNVNSEEDILWDIAKNCIRELDFVDAVIYTLDQERGVLVQRAAYGNKEDGEFRIFEPIEIPLGQGIVGKVAITGEPKLVRNTAQDPSYIVDDESRLSEIAVPIIGPEGILGVIDSEHPAQNFYTEEHLLILTTIANIAANKIVRARVVDALEKAKEKAELATRAKSNFLSSMSHEIRTPLNAVIGLSHLLAEEIEQVQHKESLNTLLSSAKHLLSLINDVLDFSKIEEGKLKLDKVDFALDPLIEDLANGFRFSCEEKQLDFRLNRPEKLSHSIIGDDTRLRQILTNLLGNALKFTQTGSLELGYEVLGKQDGTYQLKFVVKDSGIGIAPARQALVFERFAQAETDTTRQFGGTGLGLAICQKLVELHAGQIGVESNNDPALGPTGTTFWFELEYPISGVASNRERSRVSSFPNLVSLKGLKVLLVEDNRVNVMVAKRFLEKWKVQVQVAEDGLIATEMVREQEFDLILMDLNMPVMGGLEATEVIRATNNDIPIIALTADATSEIREKVFTQGMNGYLMKPFEPSQLHKALHEYLPIMKQ